MEVMFVTVIILQLSCRLEVTPAAAEEAIKTPTIQYIKTGDTVDLFCDKNHRDKTMWFGQKSNRSPFIILSAEMISGERPSRKFHWGYNSRMNVTWNKTNNSMKLSIKNINESDEGFYFCTVGDGILTTPGTGHILQMDDGKSSTSSPPVSNAGQMNSIGTSKQCGIVWILVTILCFISILLTALVIMIIQKKRGRSGRTSQTELGMRRVENERRMKVYSTVRYASQDLNDLKGV